MSRILNIGSINLDEIFSVASIVRGGETSTCLDYRRGIGGKGANQSIALARAGAEVHHAGKIGADGRGALELLREAGADTSKIEESATASGRALIQVAASGENAIIVHGGANRTISPTDIDAYLEGWGVGDAVLLQNEISCLDYALAAVVRRGLRVFLNPSPADAAIAALSLDSVSCLILNEVEAAILAGAETGRADPDRLLASLRERFPRADIVLTLGAAGARFLGGDGLALAVPAAAVRAIDTTAAGDTFTGYFIAAVLRGEPTAAALSEATRAAGICVTRAGAASSIPTRAELRISP